MKSLRKVLKSMVVASAVVFTGLSDVTRAADLSISSVPLFLGGNAAPNIMFTLDDSGSMQFEVLPDELIYKDIYYTFPIGKTIYGGSATAFYRARNGTAITSDCGAGSGSLVPYVCVPGYEDNNLYNYKYRSVKNNKSYYNPDVTYTPWSQADGTTFYPNAVPTCAYQNPFDTTVGCRNLTALNIGATNTPTDSYAKWLHRTTAAVPTYEWKIQLYANAQTAVPGFWPATYFNFNITNASCDGSVDNRVCYDKVEVRSTIPSYTSPGGVVRNYSQEIQNFANWYTYYRSRVLLARAGTGRAFASQSGGFRVGFAAINKASATIDGAPSQGALIRGVRNFSGADRTNFFNDLYGHAIPTAGTPLRRALDNVGQYFSRIDDAGPWGEFPGTGGGTQLACRQSYNILTTDGYWNAAVAPTLAARGNVDNTSGPLITNNSNPPVPLSYTYAPVAPYKDAWGDPNPHLGTLADVAMYYWNRDLHSGLLNKVPTNPADPAFWQHMVTFTVGLGVFGTLDPANDIPELTLETKSWPMPWNSNPNNPQSNPPAPDPPAPASWQAAYNIDDLWHAAVNSRGDFFSASDPEKFAQGLSASLATISGRSGSASSIALNSTSLRAGSSVYQARFNSADWSGQLLSIPILSTGALGPEEWDAAEKLDGQDYDTGRKIVTFKPSARKGIRFRWPANPALPAATEMDLLSQVTELDKNPSTSLPDTPTPLGSQRLDYLRGKDVAGMRPRAKKLGDIVHSSPAFVGAPIFRYPDTWASGAPENGAAAPYSMFKSNNKTRKPLVYAGANDGMLHAFDASTSVSDRGTEVFAYVPAAVYKNLNQLTNPTYAHRFFVDGAPTVGDAFFDGSWHTVLVGGLRAGGQAIYALDITDPPGSSDDETVIATKVLWEFNDVEGLLPTDPDYGDKDLGDTFSEPNIVRMKNGEWAAVFGNGYNNTASDGPTTTSATGNAVLYIVNIKTGALIKKIDTGVGKLQDPKNTTAANQRPNGLATPAPIDTNGDSIVDYIYAGDLFGNLWKFDVNSAIENDWKVLGPSGGPLFVACAGTGTQCTTAGASNLRQPITTRPQVGRHPTKAEGFMVYFGTGKYIEGPDIDAKPTGQTTQTFYGVWDENQSSPSTTFGRTNLLQQQILKEVSQGFDTNGDDTDDDFFDLRVTSDNPINWDTPALHKGWYMDLINTGESPLDNEGERQVTDSILRDGRIIFTTLIPSADPCDFGGTGWLMEIDARDGSRLEFSPFDLNADGTFDGKDHVTLAVDIDGDGDLDPVPPGGKKSKVGIPPTPGVVSDSSDPNKPPKELKYTSGSTGKIEVTTENPGSGNVGRRSWRELQLQ